MFRTSETPQDEDATFTDSSSRRSNVNSGARDLEGAMFSGSEAWAWKIQVSLGSLLVLTFAGCLLTR